jgi:hypothetical protein
MRQPRRTPAHSPALSSALALVVVASLPAGADQASLWMTESELRTTFTGVTIDGHYQNGRTFTETYAAEGGVDYRDSVRVSGGHWSIVAGTFCTIYDDDPAGGCFRVMRSGENCYEFYFVARTEEQAATPGSPDWSARGWLNSKPATCTDGANV